ncbi:MAG TPA: nitrite reductase small subunit NirD [Steroidobacteraceae bacterium]|nr:nitrite reductase small subunit NirD [Steroidobacteraceae bacterium]
MNAALQEERWQDVCALDDLVDGTGVCALVGGRQIALFLVDERVYALDNFDPGSRANVLSRGLTGDLQNERVVASPIYKHHFVLGTGRCLEDPTFSVTAYATRVVGDRVHVEIPRAARRIRLVIAGNGMAGMRTVEELLKLGVADRFQITVFGAEPRGNYNRILLSPVLSGEQQADDIMLHRPNWYSRRGITLHSGDPIVEIDRKRRLVRSKKGTLAPYDRLLIATGSDPIMLPLPGRELPGVVTFRDLDDVNRMLEASGTGRRAVVIGGGLLGLEAAHGLALRGMQVTVVHLVDTLMERQLDAAAGALLKAALEKRGIQFRMRAKTQELLGDERVTAVKFDDGEVVPADLVVMAVGVRPNMDLAKRANLACDRGILVDDTLQTFDPSIYAVGECVQHRRQTFGLVAPLWEQARICAQHIAEIGVSRFSGAINATQLKVSGIEVFSAGDFAEKGNRESLVLQDRRRGIYKRVVLEGNRVCGAVLFGDVREAGKLRELIADGTDVTPIRDQLLFDSAAA